MNKVPVTIFDLDSCLSDDNHRKFLLPNPDLDGLCEENYAAYHARLCDDNKFSAWDAFRRCCNASPGVILIVTARPESVRKQTDAWLKKQCTSPSQYVDLSNVILLMRPAGDSSHSPLLKVGLIWRWAHQQRHAVEFHKAYDDRVDVLRAYEAAGIVAWDDCVMVTKDFLVSPPLGALAEPTTNGEPGVLVVQPKKRKPTPPSLLRDMAATYEERNKVYGDNFLRVGGILQAMFPNGVKLSSAEDFVRWHLFELKIVKLSRFAVSGLTHQDSIHDDGVYSAMVESLLTDNPEAIGDAK